MKQYKHKRWGDIVTVENGKVIDMPARFLTEEWEDYETSSGWAITMYGGITRIDKDDEFLISDLKEIGNYFNDKESTYDALDKLKAWKRLKAKGFKFKGWSGASGSNNQVVYCDFGKVDVSLLNLLFGGEE